MNIMHLAHNSGLADKAQGVVLGSAAVQVVSSYATEITLAITLLSFVVMWFYKHKTSKQDEDYKKELLAIKRGEYSRLLMKEIEKDPKITPEQLTLLKEGLKDIIK